MNCVPPEYEWEVGEEDADVRERGGCGIQRMTIDTWLDVIERERERGDGHIGPTGVGNLPLWASVRGSDGLGSLTLPGSESAGWINGEMPACV